MSTSINTSGLQLDQLGSQIKASIRLAEHAEDKSLNHYKAAGLYLQEAKNRVEAGEHESKHFSHYLQSYCPMSSSRAYELIAIANGTTTIEAVRAATNIRKQAFRSRTEKPQPSDSTQKKISKPINLGGRPPVDQLTHLRILIGKQAKLMQTKEQLVQALELITNLNN